jgi:hypothetical protein
LLTKWVANHVESLPHGASDRQQAAVNATIGASANCVYRNCSRK